MADKPIKILLFEDNPGDVRLIQEMLVKVRDMPFKLESVDLLSSGLKRLAIGDIDVVLVDLGLPDSQGLDTFTKVHAQVPELPIVMLTGLDNEMHAIKAMRKGAQDYLVKQKVDSNLLGRSIRYAIERKRGEEALRESKEKYSALFMAARDAIYITTREGRILDANPAMVELFGYRREELLQLSAQDVYIHPENRTRFQRIIEVTGAVRSYSIHLKKKDGTKMECLLTSTVRQDKDGSILGYQGIIRDITEQKRAEEARQDLEERRANFIEITSHELRTPLTAIQGFVEILEYRLEDLDRAGREWCFDLIKRNCQRLGRLITGVSTLGQLERGMFRLVFQKIDFFNLFTEAMAPYQTRLGQQLEVRGLDGHAEGDRGLGSFDIKADPDRLLQVFNNLLENAVKNTPKNGRRIIVTLERHPKVIRVSVVDNGAGIAPEDLKRIFESFMAIPTKYSAGGTGIGLYLAQMIVEAHGGNLTAQSNDPDQGATFIVELPR